MPTYQYVCTNAEDKHDFEVVQSFSDPSVTECPQCGSSVRKVYGSVGVVFKGSGFYRTDSRTGSSSESSSESSNGSAAKKESTGDSSSSKTSSSSAPSAGSASGARTTSSTTKAAD